MLKRQYFKKYTFWYVSFHRPIIKGSDYAARQDL